MLNNENAKKYVKYNLKKGGIAVLNIGDGRFGRVYVFKKDLKGKIYGKSSNL